MREIEFNKDLDIREYRRWVIVQLHERQMSQAFISQVLGCSQSLVSQVITTYKEEGLSGLKSQEHPGARPNLSSSDKERLKKNIASRSDFLRFPG